MLAAIAIFLVVCLAPGDGKSGTGLNASEKAMARNAALHDYRYDMHRINDTSFYIDIYVSLNETERINYTIGDVVRPPADYYCYNASQRLAIVPIRNERTQAVTNYTVDLDLNRSISSLMDVENTYTYRKEMDLIKAALKDSNVSEVLSEDNMSYRFTIKHISPKDAGYLNDTGDYASISIDARIGDMIEIEHLYLTMDTADDRMVGFIDSSDMILPRFPSWHIIPHGASFIHHILSVSTYGNTRNIIILFTGIRYVPENASVYTTIVDGDNLENLKNGSAYKPLEVFDLVTNKTVRFDDSEPVYSGWTTNVRFAGRPLVLTGNGGKSYDGTGDPQHYLVIRNAYSTEIKVTFIEDVKMPEQPPGVNYP